MGEKNLDPTEQRLEDSRKKGQVPVSKDFAHCLVLGVGLEIAFALEKSARQQIAQLFDLSLRLTQNDFQASLSNMLTASGTVLLLSFVIYAVANVALGIFGYWGQFGVIFSTTPLTPDLNKLNPLNTLKGIFSIRKLMETLLSVAKLTCFGLLSYAIIRSELPDIVSLAGGNVSQAYAAAIALLHGLARVLIGLSICLAIIDFFVQRQAHIKQLRMSLEEVIREYKENEGDPLIKGARKQLAFELATSDPVKNTEQANAVVVNPTHFAVAMLYDPETAPVPIICAKGHDDTAQAMIRRAQEKNIPVIRHVWLARTLFATAKVKKRIPVTLFDPVALLYSIVSQMNTRGLQYHVLSNSEHPPKED